MLAPYSARLGFLLARELTRPAIPLLEEVRLPMRVWPTDVDYYLHVNNGRYLTLMDIGRYQLALRTGMLRLGMRRHWWPVLGAASIRFRREIRLFERFELVSRLLGWDEMAFYIEQRFERGGTVHATSVVKAVLLCRGRKVPFARAAVEVGASPESPPLPELADWNAVWHAKPAREGAAQSLAGRNR